MCIGKWLYSCIHLLVFVGTLLCASAFLSVVCMSNYFSKFLDAHVSLCILFEFLSEFECVSVEMSVSDCMCVC